MAAGADCKTPHKAQDHDAQIFHPLTLTAFTGDESVAAQIAEHLVTAGGAVPAADVAKSVTIFHRLVAHNRVKTVEALLKVDPSAKTVAKFFASKGPSAVSPISSAFGQGFRAMAGVLIAFGECRAYIDQETNDRCIAAA